ncbi:MAG: NAD(P)H-dependent oxidoreductase [Candidatus Aquicultor sp.]
MKILIVLGHPGKGSFNHAIANTAVEALNDNGHEVMFHDLYEEGFDPILPVSEIPKEAGLDRLVQRHCDELAIADGIIIVHPNWWGQPPAILKGWIDRVIRPGVAYEFTEDDSGEGVPIGLLKAQSVLVFNTSNTPEKREREVFGDPLERIWKDCIFDLCGVGDFYRKMFRVIVTSTEEQRKSWFAEVRQTVGRYYPINAGN